MSHEYPKCIRPDQVDLIVGWLRTRGGVKLWTSADLGDLGKFAFGPVNDPDGKPTTKPSWWCHSEPERIYTTLADFEVEEMAPFGKPFRVAIRPARNRPFSWKLTDASSARVRRKLDRAGEGSSYEFDYEDQTCQILQSAKRTPLEEWLKIHPVPEG